MRTRAPIGFPFLATPGDDGTLSFPTSLDASVRQQLRIILSTQPGELLSHPDFGAGLDSLLHEPNSLSLRKDIHDRISESLTRWEPRIELDRVDVNEVPGEPTRLRVEIAYRLRRTGVPATLGLTLSSGV
jgi:phage baseplate assembly protein W